MKRSLLATTAGAALLIAFAFATPATQAQELSAKEVKKIQKQADKAWGSGELDQAAELFEQILAATAPTDRRRGDALYALAMIRLSPATQLHDPAAGRRHLDQLATAFPRHPRHLEVATVRALFDQLDAAGDQLAQSARELAAKEATLRTELEKVAAERQEIAGENAAAGDRVKSLQAQLRSARAQLSETRAELEKKEAALQKLRDALVNRAGGP